MNGHKNKIVKLLRWTEKYTKTDMVYLAKGGFWLTLGQFVSAVSVLVLGLAYANLWNPIDYGNYKYILSLGGIFGIFALSGMGTAITQAVARGLENSFYSAFREKFKWGALGSTVAIILSAYYFYKGNIKLSLPLLIVALTLPLMEASKTYLGFLQGKKKFDTKVKYEILSTVLPVIALVATLYVTNSLLLMILVYFSSHTILNFLFYLRTKNVFDPNEKSDPKTISVGKKQSLINIVNTIANNLDQLLVFHFLGAQELAIYAFAIVLPDKIRDILKSVQHLALPKFACKESGEIKKSFLEKTVRLILVSLPVLIAYVLVAPFLYQFFFPEYLASVRYSQIFALSILANPGLSVAALDAKLAIKEKYIFNIFFGGVRIVLMLFFVLQFGLLGIILAKVIARFLSFFLSLFLIKKL